MNTLSPFISLAAHSFRESVVSVNAARGLSGFTVPHSFSLAFALRPTPPLLSFSSNPHQTCLTVWTQRRPLTRLQNSFICGLRRSNLDLIKQHYWSLVWDGCSDRCSPPEGSVVQLSGSFSIWICLCPILYACMSVWPCETSLTKGLCKCIGDQGDVIVKGILWLISHFCWHFWDTCSYMGLDVWVISD